MITHNGLPPSVIETIAGFTAGIISTLAVHPLDVIKTRLQGEHPLGPYQEKFFGAEILSHSGPIVFIQGR